MADRGLINLTNRLELVNEQPTEVREVIDQEGTLIEALRTRGRSTRKAEELLGLFQEISSYGRAQALARKHVPIMKVRA